MTTATNCLNLAEDCAVSTNIQKQIFFNKVQKFINFFPDPLHVVKY